MARELHGPLDLNGNPITGLPLTPTVDTEAASKAYVDAAAGTGSDEVAISPTQPVAVGLELWIDTDAPPLAGGGGGGVTDHGDLTGLADDDHTQYALANGTRGTFEVAGAVAAHAAAPDPHPAYLTAAEAEPSGAVATHAATAGHEPLTSVTPAALGSAAAGVATTVARADHVHAMPSAANVGALTQAQADTLYAPKVVIAASKPGSPTAGTIWVPAG